MASPSTTTCPPHFRLLLHGKDGSIPYLTPELMRLMFCPELECNGNGNGDDNKGSSSSSSLDDDDDDNHNWKWRREHFILGVAAKDTCVTATYRKVTTPNKRKKDDEKDDNGGDQRSAKRTRKEQQPTDNTTTTSTIVETTERDPSDASPPFKNDTKNNGNTDKMKPSGYTFITSSQSYQLCSLINSHAKNTSNYLQSYLRIPKYISTLIVPTFSLDYPNLPSTLDEDLVVENNINKVNKKHEPKKPKPPLPRKQQRQNQQHTNRDVIPNSSKDSMPIDTPHGWQKIRPEQYWDAVIGLTQPVGTFSSLEHDTNTPITSSESSSSSSSSESVCEGAVGLFDHMGISRDPQLNDKSNPLSTTSESHEVLASLKIMGKRDAILQRVTQRTNEWSFRVLNYCAHQEQQAQQLPSVKFWTPVHLAASQLPLKALLACPSSRQTNNGNIIPTCPNVAIVGWDSIIYHNNREFRRQGLHNLLATMNSSSPSPPQKYLVLSVSDLLSILDIAREGAVSIIGTDLVRQWSLTGRALCLDLNFDGTAEREKGVMGGMIDMKDEMFARDSSPILPGCKCLACRPRLTSVSKSDSSSSSSSITDSKSSCSDSKKVPSFSRSYIHHLMKANEMLAETLLFVHNLHHVLLLFRQLSRAVSLDAEFRRDGKENKGNTFEAFCNRVEEQLKSSDL